MSIRHAAQTKYPIRNLQGIPDEPWTPIRLFSTYDNGAWYDPSDLSTLFQDSEGTIPVTTDGQPVGKILDKSGKNNHAIQPTAGKRPTYRTASNAHWLDFDGVDDALYTATINLSGTSKLTVFAGTANSKTLSTGTLIESSANYLNNGGSFALLTPSLATSHISFGTHGSAGAGEKETQNPPAGQLEKRVITAAQDFATTNDYGCDYIRVHQIPIANLVGSGNTAVGAGPLGNYPVYIGARNNGSNAANGNSLWGRIYSLIFVGEMYDEATLVKTEEWIDAKMVETVFEPVWSWYAYQVAIGATATFTRASTAYVVDHDGLYWKAAANWPRYQGARIADPMANGQLVYYNTTAGGMPIDPAAISLMMEPATTNRVKYSNDLTQINVTTAWDNNSNAWSQAAGATTGPDGAPACSITWVDSGRSAWILQTLGGLTGAQQLTISVWLKGTGVITQICIWDNVNGWIPSSPITLTSTWTRYNFTATTNAACTQIRVGFGPSGSNTLNAPIYVWQYQAVVGSVSSSPINTTTAAVTRAVDALAYSDVPADNETRFIINGANVDVDDWNGIYPTPTAPKLLNSISVYNPGERPA